MPLDPLSLSPLGLGGGVARAAHGRPAANKVQLTPEEEDSLLMDLGRSAASGLSTFGAILDTPASWVRNTIAGENPFKGTFSPEDRTRGVDLLRQWGVASNEDTWGNFLGGLGVEMATDPFFFVGGLTKALGVPGKVAKAAGVLDDLSNVTGKGVGKRVGLMTKRIDDLINVGSDAQRATRKAAVESAAKGMGTTYEAIQDKPLGGLLNVGVPGVPSLQKVLFTDPDQLGGAVGKVAGALDTMGSGIARSAPGRFGRMLFDPSVDGQYSLLGQEVAQDAYNKQRRARWEARGAYATAKDNFLDLYQAFDPEYGDFVRGGPATAAKIEGIDYGVGDVVKAADRDNFGYVQALAPDAAEVFFRNPESGATSVVKLPHNQLTLTHAKGSPEAALFAREKTTQVLDDLVRLAGETDGDVQKAMKFFLPNAPAAPSKELSEKIAKTARAMQDADAAIHGDIEAKGGILNWITGFEDFAHMPRYVDHKGADAVFRSPRFLPAAHEGMKSRDSAIRAIPAAVINELIRDPAARGTKAGQYIFSKYSDWLGQGFEGANEIIENAVQKNAPEDQLNAMLKAVHAGKVAEWVAEHPKEYVSGNRAMFTHSSLEDFLRYQTGAQKVSKSLDAIHGFFANHLSDAAEGGLALTTAYRKVGLQGERAVQYLANLTGKSAEELAKMSVPLDVAQAAAGLREVTVNPTWRTALGETIDKFNRMFKNAVTVPWPSYMTRNLGSGQYVNIATGLVNSPRDLKDYVVSFKDAWKLMRGKGDKPLQQYLRELDIYEVVGKNTGAEDVDLFRAAGQGIRPESPLNIGQSSMEATRELAAKREVQKLAGRKPTPTLDKMGRPLDTYMRTAGKINQAVEWQNRVTPYLYLRRKGWSPAAAAERVNAMQFDYNALAPFEREVARRAIPFYSFSRKMGELFIRDILERPGGPVAQTIRATDRAKSRDPLLPDYVAGTAAIPMAPGPGGESRYLTGFGLAHEDPLSFVGYPNDALLEGASRLSPLFKFPLELATQETFFQKGPGGGGRSLDDLDPLVGRLLTNVATMAGSERKDPVKLPQIVELAAANSPFTRLLSTARTLTDRRKTVSDHIPLPGPAAANLLTGLRVTDVSPGSRDAVIREALGQVMKGSGAKAFERLYIPKDALAGMAPEDQARALQLQALMDTLARRAMARKEAAQRKQQNALAPF